MGRIDEGAPAQSHTRASSNDPEASRRRYSRRSDRSSHGLEPADGLCRPGVRGAARNTIANVVSATAVTTTVNITATAVTIITTTSIDMAKKSTTKRTPKGIDEQLREAILNSSHKRAAIARETGIADAVLSRFVTEDEYARRDLRLATAAKIAAFLGLELAPKKRGR
ncbi:MAG TPA: helix-turn-helix transcriptional regulator [Pirellulales bacterium]|nr:helix-turn-helix transcriptional regulator [Pirellulales bacterium]